MISHAQILLAARAHALGLIVCQTGSISLESSANGGLGAASAFIRSAGSFLTEGFAAGMEVSPAGFPSNDLQQITHISEDGLIMTVDGELATVAAAGARSLVVGFPESVAFGGLHFDPPQGKASAHELYTPGTSEKVTLGPLGDVEARPLFSLNIATPANMGDLAALRYVDALLAHFASGVVITLANGDIARVRGGRTEPAPTASQLQYDRPGLVIAPVTIPLRIRTPNAI